MAAGQVDFKERQAEELSRYKALNKVYAFVTRNPAGMRFTNLQRALNATAASKLVGWPPHIDSAQFLTSVCENIRDYVSEPFWLRYPSIGRQSLLIRRPPKCGLTMCKGALLGTLRWGSFWKRCVGRVHGAKVPSRINFERTRTATQTYPAFQIGS